MKVVRAGRKIERKRYRNVPGNGDFECGALDPEHIADFDRGRAEIFRGLDPDLAPRGIRADGKHWFLPEMDPLREHLRAASRKRNDRRRRAGWRQVFARGRNIGNGYRVEGHLRIVIRIAEDEEP